MDFEIIMDNNKFTIQKSGDKYILTACPQNATGVITIPSGINEIADGAFHGCTGITGLILPNCLNSFGDNVFKECPNLSTLDIDNAAVTRIGGRTFRAHFILTAVNND